MPNAKNPTSPEYQRLVAANPKYQAAFDRLLAAASSDKRRPRKDQKDSEIMVQSWFEWWEQGGDFDTIALGIIPRWSDDDVADWEGISKDTITNAKRIEFARGWIDRTAEEHTGFDAVKVKASNGETAWVAFAVQIQGQGGPGVKYFGIFRNLREFWQSFKEDGWLNTSKISNKRVLDLWSKL